MVALVEALGSHPQADFCCVITDNAEAQGVAKARTLGLAVHIIERDLCVNKKQFEQQLTQCLHIYQPHLIVLAGFMQVLSAEFIHQFPYIINIHPSLLPKYPGLDTHQRALDNHETEVGATVHWVNEVTDGGEIIAQCRIKVRKNDTAQTLAQRLLPKEHQLYQKVVKGLLENNSVFTL